MQGVGLRVRAATSLCCPSLLLDALLLYGKTSLIKNHAIVLEGSCGACSMSISFLDPREGAEQHMVVAQNREP